jgi:hypothetical protein
VSESRDDGQPESGGQPADQGGQPASSGQQKSSSQPKSSQPRSSSQPANGGSSGQSRTNGQAGGSGGQSRRGSDPVADFQRWLMRAGARSMASQVADQVKRTLGQERRDYGDVWDAATNEPPPNEPPECQWCPICQAARAARMSGPGLGARLADAGGALAAAVQDAFAAFDQLMKVQDQARSPERTRAIPPSSEPDPGNTGQ